VTTQRDDRVYVHVLDWSDRELALPPLGRRVRAAQLLAGGARVPFRESATGLALTLPPQSADEIDRVVVLELAK
jgi:alpha-L-fucosidase